MIGVRLNVKVFWPVPHMEQEAASSASGFFYDTSDFLLLSE